MVGENKDILSLHKDIQTMFTFTLDNNIKNFIGCHLNFTNIEEVVIHQQETIDKMKIYFLDEVNNLHDSVTPGIENTVIKKLTDKDTQMS